MTTNRTLKWTAMGSGLLLVSSLAAQTARLQVIHNCADLNAAVVDVYVNDAITIPDFAFRTATPFIDVPAGVTLNIQIAPGNSTSSAEALVTIPAVLASGETYIAVASGTLGLGGYNPATPFTLEVFGNGREVAQGPGTDVLVLHGSTDAPTVDVFESAVVGTTIIDDLSYAEFAGYLELPTSDYTLQVRTADNSAIVAAYAAPLQTLNLEGRALTVLASGFLDPSQNSNGPGFGLWAALSSGGPLVELPSAPIPTASIQAIHNSADAAAAEVDVYLNGALIVDDFAFRTATPFVDVQAGVDLTLSIAPGNSTSVDDAIADFNYNLEEGGSYVLVANGIVSPSGYSPATAFDIYVSPGALQASPAGTTSVLAFHGATDAPVVDVYESAVLNATAIDDLAYGTFAGYLELPTNDYVLQVRTSDNSAVVAAYAAPLQTLGLDGAALVVVASGFLNPANNSNGAGFGLWAALPTGGALVELPAAEIPTARIQAIHNSADLAAAEVDVYLNGSLLVDDFAFRTATPFVDVQAGVDLVLSIAPGNSTSVDEALVNFDYNLPAGGSFILVANGIVSSSGYSPATPFDIYVQGDAREVATSGANNTDILVFHGCTDAPVVDVAETAVLGGATIVDDLGYGSFDGYLEVPTLDFTLQVQTADGTPLLNYLAPLETLGLQGAALTVVASGFLDPSVNSSGAGFGLWVALPSGGPLVQLPIATSLNEQSNLSSFIAWPNPVNDVLTIDVETAMSAQADVRLTDMTGRVVRSLAGSSLATGTNRLMLDVDGLAEGSYTLSITSDGERRALPIQIVR